MKQGEFLKSGHEYLHKQPWDNAVGVPDHYKLETNQPDFERKIKLDAYVQMAKIKLLSLPYVGNKEKMAKEMTKLKMMMVNKQISLKIMGYFRWHNEIHEVKKLLGMI